jgi:hypothetical protein
MFLPIVIFMMILSPVLIPALTTACNLALTRWRNSRRAGGVGVGWMKWIVLGMTGAKNPPRVLAAESSSTST